MRHVSLRSGARLAHVCSRSDAFSQVMIVPPLSPAGPPRAFAANFLHFRPLPVAAEPVNVCLIDPDGCATFDAFLRRLPRTADHWQNRNLSTTGDVVAFNTKPRYDSCVGKKGRFETISRSRIREVICLFDGQARQTTWNPFIQRSTSSSGLWSAATLLPQ